MSCWATLADELLVSRFGRLLTGGRGQWGARLWAAGLVVQLPNGALERPCRGLEAAQDIAHTGEVWQNRHM